MSEQHKKLQMLLHASEEDERRALERKLEFDLVVAQRQSRCEDIQREIREIRSKESGAGEPSRRRALYEGDVESLHYSYAFSLLTRKKIEELERISKEREVELLRGRERVEQAQSQWLEARLERKKLENILAKQVEEERARSRARESLAEEEEQLRFGFSKRS